MALLDTINLDFHVISTMDPKVLVVMDTSVWGFIEDKPAIIEITPPGSTNTKKFTFVKGKTNVFNSSNLLLSPIGKYNDLSDGIYRISVKGSPDSNCMHRDYLKTDRARLELSKIYISLGTSNDEGFREKKGIIQDAELLIRAAEASVSRGNLKKGMMYFKKAMHILNNYNECENCN